MYLRLALLQGRWMVLKYKGRGQDLRTSSNKWSYIRICLFFLKYGEGRLPPCPHFWRPHTLLLLVGAARLSVQQWTASHFLWHLQLLQSRRKVWKSERGQGGSRDLVGIIIIISPRNWNRVSISANIWLDYPPPPVPRSPCPQSPRFRRLCYSSSAIIITVTNSGSVTHVWQSHRNGKHFVLMVIEGGVWLIPL